MGTFCHPERFERVTKNFVVKDRYARNTGLNPICEALKQLKSAWGREDI